MEPFIILAVICGVGGLVILAIVLHRHYERKRAEAMEQAAQSLGFEYLGPTESPLPVLLAGFELMNRGRGRKFKNVMLRTADDRSVFLCDYQYTTSNGKNSTTHHQSLAVIQSAAMQLPAFQMYPENMLSRIGQMLGMQDIDFEDAPEFSRRFVLRGNDESAIREYFSPAALEEIAKLGAVNVAGEGDRLMVWFAGRRVKPEDVRKFFETAFQIHVLMTS
jgi:hypothetical protein